MSFLLDLQIWEILAIWTPHSKCLEKWTNLNIFFYRNILIIQWQLKVKLSFDNKFTSKICIKFKVNYPNKCKSSCINWNKKETVSLLMNLFLSSWMYSLNLPKEKVKDLNNKMLTNVFKILFNCCNLLWPPKTKKEVPTILLTHSSILKWKSGFLFKKISKHW